MRKHSLNHIGSHQNLKVFLNHQLNKKIHYFPENKSHKRDNTTKPKKYQHKKDNGFCGSWLYQSNKQNKNRGNINDNPSKKAIKTTKKNSCSYIVCNTSVEESNDNRNFQTFNFGNIKTIDKQIFRLPIAVTDGDIITRQQPTRNNFSSLYQRFKGLLTRYQQEVILKQKKIKQLKKQNKMLREKSTKYSQKKN